MKALDDIKKSQQQKQQEKALSDVDRVTTFDYFADDEDPLLAKGSFNSFLSQPYMLEIASLGSVAAFFALTSLIPDSVSASRKA